MNAVTFPYTETREMSGGEFGNIVSLDAEGHLGYEDAELFMATVVAEELDDGDDFVHPMGIEIEHLWRSEHPIGDDEAEEYDHEVWTYYYTESERPGAVPVTRFQIAQHWTRPASSPTAPRAEYDRVKQSYPEGTDEFPIMCVNHPDEIAVTGIPVERFTENSRDRALDGYIHYCRPCSKDFDERWLTALTKDKK